MPAACDMGHGRGRTRRDGRSACDLAGMGARRARLRYRLRALPCRGGAGGYCQSAGRFLQPFPMTTPIDRQATFSGTKEVAPPLAIDVARLEPFLSARLPDFHGPLAVGQFKGGQSSPSYLVQTLNRRYVLRRKPPGKLLPSAHAVDREFRVISALYRQNFPVPAPIVYCDDADVVGTPFFVMAYVDGRIFWEPHLPGSNPAERAAVYDAANATIARLHSFDPVVLGLADFGRGENSVARQIERWSKQYQAS